MTIPEMDEWEWEDELGNSVEEVLIGVRACLSLSLHVCLVSFMNAAVVCMACLSFGDVIIE